MRMAGPTFRNRDWLSMRRERVETLIIGGGQAGLAMSHMLSQRGCRHLVLERGRIAERWRTERWDGLRFQFPNWSVKLPGFSLSHPDAEAFATSREILDFLTAYADYIAAPIRCGVTVRSLRADTSSSAFLADTSEGTFEAVNVVIATGPYQQPVVPDLLRDSAALFQVHASKYQNPDQLPAGAVLIVGSGASGAQIAEELMAAGRRVFLSVGRHRRMPRRYRGRDLIWWLAALGLDRTPVEKRGPDKALPLITGAYGGHTIDFREFAERGMVLLGHLQGARGSQLDFAPDLMESLMSGDAAYAAFLDAVDAHVRRQGMDIPEEPGAREVRPDPACVQNPLRSLDLRTSVVKSVIWATGYRCDFSWIELPVLNDSGEPVHRGGICDVPGLYFIGLPWLSKMNSSFLAGVGDDAARLADRIAAQTCRLKVGT
jgi:putative flavoprotein involved in K+ transport